MTDLNPLIDKHDLAVLLQCSEQTLGAWARKFKNFPRPCRVTPVATPLWFREEIYEWLKKFRDSSADESTES